MMEFLGIKHKLQLHVANLKRDAGDEQQDYSTAAASNSYVTGATDIFMPSSRAISQSQ